MKQWEAACAYLLSEEAYDREAVREAAQIMRNEIEMLQARSSPAFGKFDVAVGIARAMKTQANDLLDRLESLTHQKPND